jgi:hypothetical protein
LLKGWAALGKTSVFYGRSKDLRVTNVRAEKYDLKRRTVSATSSTHQQCRNTPGTNRVRGDIAYPNQSTICHDTNQSFYREEQFHAPKILYIG